MSDRTTSSSFLFEADNQWQDCFGVILDLYQKGQLCDITLVVGDKSIRCHQLVLASASPYFKAMLTSGMSESIHQKIHIHDISEDAVEALVQFIYTSKIMLTVENVQQLLHASSLLQIEVVVDACCRFMEQNFDPSNVIGVRDFALLHGLSNLSTSADLFAVDRFTEVVECEEFVSLSQEHLNSLLSSDDLNVDSEVQVYEALIKWVGHDVPNRESYLSDLLFNVRLFFLPLDYLMKHVEKNYLLRKSLSCRDYVDEAKNFHLCRQLRGDTNFPKITTKFKPRKATAGVLFAVGGRGTSGDPFRTTEVYNFRKNEWFQISDMSYKRRHVGVTAVHGKVYAAGGHDGKQHLNTLEEFDPQTNQWTTLSPMATARRGMGMASLGGPLYAVGGLDDSSCFTDVERYDIQSDTWSVVTPMNSPRGGVAVATLLNHIYAVGGNDGSLSLSSCERYDPHTNKWTEIEPMHIRRAGCGVVILDGYLYAIGGFDDNAPLDSVERYCAQTNKWSFVASLCSCRGGVGVTALGGYIYSVGGHNGSHYLSSVERYDPDNNQWESVGTIGMCRAGAGVVTCNCSIKDLKRNELTVANCV